MVGRVSLGKGDNIVGSCLPRVGRGGLLKPTTETRRRLLSEPWRVQNWAGPLWPSSAVLDMVQPNRGEKWAGLYGFKEGIV